MNRPVLTRWTACYAVIASLAALAFVGTALAQDRTEPPAPGAPSARTRPAGNEISETRSVPAFRAVHALGSLQLVLRPAARESVQVRGEEAAVRDLETTVVERDGVPTLRIGMRPGAARVWRSPLVVTVDVTTLQALRLSGAGDAVAEGLQVGALKVSLDGANRLALRKLKADALSVALSGSGSVQASGRSGSLAVSISGSGSMAAPELEADQVDISIAGSGDAQVNARRALAVSIAGSGDVTYTGEATVTQRVAGTGRVTRR